MELDRDLIDLSIGPARSCRADFFGAVEY